MSILEEAEALIRKSISEEEKAVSDYLERKQQLIKIRRSLQYNAKYNNLLPNFDTFIDNLNDIIAEEQVHIGQLAQILRIFEISDENELKGREETMDSYTKIMQHVDEILIYD